MINRSPSKNRCAANAEHKLFANPCVDVIIAAKDRADTIARAVSSALLQDAIRTVVVVDDGSTDDTAVRARRCDARGNRVLVERLHSSLGPAAARNIAIGISTAPWLAVLDADDFFLPGQIHALLSQSDDCDFVADHLVHLSESHGLPISAPFPEGAKPIYLSFKEFVLGNMARRGAPRKELGYLKPLIRRQFLDVYGLRYLESLRLGEDYALYARALAAGARFRIIPTAGYVAVERPDSLSSRHTRPDLEGLRNSDCELMAMNHLTPPEREAVAKHYADVDRRAQWLVLVEALQSRNYPQFLSTFFRSPALTLYLIMRLIEECPSQIQKLLTRIRRMTH